MHTEIKAYLGKQNTDFPTLKKQFEAYIEDRSVPLDERWNAFVEASNKLKNTQSWVVHFDSLPEDFIMYEGPIHADRNQTIETSEMVDSVVDYQNLVEGEYYFGNSNHREAMKVDVVQLKEEILASNLGSFQYDW